MKRLLWSLILLGISLPLWAGDGPHPKADIVAVLSSSAVAGAEGMPGLLAGERLHDRLVQALEMVRGGVSSAARAELETVLRELSTIRRGGTPLPAGYRVGGELWLPVRVESLRVSLDAADLQIRAGANGATGRAGDLTARARRVHWMPVERVIVGIQEALPLLVSTATGKARAGDLIAARLADLRSDIELRDRAWIDAYYGIEGALRQWDDERRESLRTSALALRGRPGAKELAARVETQANRIQPDVRELESLAGDLRKHIEAVAAENSR